MLTKVGPDQHKDEEAVLSAEMLRQIGPDLGLCHSSIINLNNCHQIVAGLPIRAVALQIPDLFIQADIVSLLSRQFALRLLQLAAAAAYL